MKVSFNNTVELQEEMGKNIDQISCSKLSSPFQTYVIYSSWLALLVGVVFFALSFFAVEDDVSNMRLVVVIALFIAIASGKFATNIFEKKRKTYIDNMRKKNAAMVDITIDETGITDCSDGIEAKISWDKVSELIALKDSFYILYGVHFIYIPFSCFDSKENLNRFAVTLEDYSKKPINKITFCDEE